MDAEGEFHIELRQQADYRFEVHFDKPGIPVLVTDEGAPVGAGAGPSPSPSQLMGTAVANCLAASLLFAMRKYKNDPSPLRVMATVRMVRNENRRLRIGNIDVDLQLGIAAADVQMLDRILAQFEDFCVVTQSVRAAIPVTVRVVDSAQTLLGASAIVSGGPA
jgi:organic hydroperoxide reductase OsmC/OhrA